MRIAIIGYGKMGMAIEKIAIEKGYSISRIIKDEADNNWAQLSIENTDVAIEFSMPDTAVANIQKLIKLNIPVVCGTTGWWNHLPLVKDYINQYQGTLIYSGNFSIGMNLLFRLNKQLAEWMDHFPEYDPWVLEKHHRNKKDAPGGSAQMLANQILNALHRKNRIVSPSELSQRNPDPDELSVGFLRAGEIIGTHEIGYGNAIDTITLQHQANSRDGFADGALRAASWAMKKKGVLNFSDLIAEQLGDKPNIS